MSIPEGSLTSSGLRTRQVKLENIRKLGGRCANPTCGWINKDGTTGCADERCLQFDHKFGGGSLARRKKGHAGLQGLLYIREHLEEFQLLCANCHSIKTREHGERLGALQHTRPARVRRSLGQLHRRVNETLRTNDRREDLAFAAAEKSFLNYVRRSKKCIA